MYKRQGLTRATLLEPASEPQALAVVALLADKADRHLASGLNYITTFPRSEHSLRLALIWPFLFAGRTLALSRNNPNVLRSEAKMTRTEIGRIVAESKLLGWSNGWLARAYARLAQPPVSDQEREPQISQIPQIF